MAHYQPLLPWIRLVLANEAPVFARGEATGVSLLFPIEKLFEAYVGKLLARQLSAGIKLMLQSSQKSLVDHRGNHWFLLQPDLLVRRGAQSVAVLDTKWKLIDADADTAREKYGLAQSDLYQMYGYGRKYLDASGAMMLIYPRHEGFLHPLPVFEYEKGLQLWVVPFDLDQGCLVDGGWRGSHSWACDVR